MTGASCPNLTKLHVYVTCRCNLYCGHCWVEAGASRRDFLEAEHVNRQIDMAIPLGLREVKITGGEPLLSENHTLSILAHACEQGLHTKLETNAVLLRYDLVSAIRSLGTVVSTSLDGSTPGSHDKFRNAPGSFNRTVHAVESLVGAGVRVEVVSCIRRDNTEELDDIIAVCNDLGVSYLKFNFPSSYGRAVELRRRLRLCSTEDIIKTVRHVEGKRPPGSEMALDFDVPRAFRVYPLPGPRCDVLNLISILPDGRFSLCGIGVTHRELTFGTIQEDDVDVVWRTNLILKEIRSAISHMARGVCGTCREYPSCLGHCAAFSLAEFGSCNAPFPLCQDAFEKGIFPTAMLRTP